MFIPTPEEVLEFIIEDIASLKRDIVENPEDEDLRNELDRLISRRDFYMGIVKADDSV